MADNQIWNELVLEAVDAASKRMGAKDFELQCRLAPIQNGKSYFDRIRVAEELIRNGLIEVEDGYLKLGSKEIPASLIKELKVGSELAWEILERFEHNNKFSQKIDLEILQQIGLDGEHAVIAELYRKIPDTEHHRIKHISLFDDSAGYDIRAPFLDNHEHSALLEVKTSPRPGKNFIFYLSQNEARVASLNKNWVLLGVTCIESEYKVLGFLFYHQFSNFLPINVDPKAKWESVKMSVPKDYFVPGLP
jgi:Domain of unknown function (DUF3883)